MMEKYYIMHYPSSSGMGSNTDDSLISETALRQLIKNELALKDSGKRYDERFTGEWEPGGELPCESDDIEERIDDVISKRRTHISTYAGVPDLIELPQDTHITVKTERMENRIFRVFGEFLQYVDVAAAETIFHRYIVDLSGFKDDLGIDITDGGICEFVSFEMKNALDEHFWETVEGIVNSNYNKINRLKASLDPKASEHLIYNIHAKNRSDDELEEWYLDSFEEAELIVEKFKNAPLLDDKYLKYLYKQSYGEYLQNAFENSVEEFKDERDKAVFTYPKCEEIGCICTDHGESCRYYTYDELFQKGADLSYPIATHIYNADGTGEVNAFRAIERVFAPH